MPESMSLERRRLLNAFGAELVLTPAAEGMHGAIAQGRGAGREPTRGTSCRSSSRTPPTPRSTARPPPRKSGATPTARSTSFVAGVGTGGTITGVGEVLKERKPAASGSIAVEPATRRCCPAAPTGPHKIQGIGAGFIPDVLDRAVIDEIVTVRDDDAFELARRLASEEGMLCGISCGAAVHAALEVAAGPRMPARGS